MSTSEGSFWSVLCNLFKAGLSYHALVGWISVGLRRRSITEMGFFETCCLLLLG